MKDTEIIAWTIHEMPEDVRVVLQNHSDIRKKREELTSLARNEWICWITIVKKQETREKHIQRLQVDLMNGKKRPCCRPGCPHHRESAKKWFT